MALPYVRETKIVIKKGSLQETILNDCLNIFSISLSLL